MTDDKLLQHIDNPASNYGAQGNFYGPVTINNTEGALAAAAGLTEARALLEHMPLDALPEIAPLPTSSVMPLRRNPLFVGREDGLKELARTLKGGGTAAIGQIAAATGLGGIGKTNLATEFVHRYGQFFVGGVYWLSFADPAVVAAQVAACGGPGGMNLPSFTELEFNDQVASVRQEWSKSIPRLLVFDNCEDEQLLDEWRPKTGSCLVIVTSRRSQWAASLGVTSLPLDILSRTESVALLKKYRPDLRGTDADMIAQELGDLPLALHLAGSFLATYRNNPTLGSPQAYLHQLRSRPLLHHPSLEGHGTRHAPTGHELHVARTFALSYDQLAPADITDTLALQLLARAACFAPNIPIPHELLMATLAIDNDELDTAMLAEDGIVRLLALGLLEEERDSTNAEDAVTLRLHRLLAAFVLELATDDAAQDAVEGILNNAMGMRQDTGGYIASLTDILEHVFYVTALAVARGDIKAAMLASWLGLYLQQIGDLAGARSYYEQALAIREQLLGLNHIATATSLINLGSLLQDQGDSVRARSYYEQALAIREQLLGANHPDTATSLINLGSLLRAQGDLRGARSFQERALAIYEQQFGLNHPYTAVSLNNLGLLLRVQGDLQGARSYHERALAIFERELGPNHPHTATSLNDLGLLLRVQGDLQGARSYHERALTIFEREFGPNHLSTATSHNNLGALLRTQGNLQEARLYYERALAIWERVVGNEHPNTQIVRDNIASLDVEIARTTDS